MLLKSIFKKLNKKSDAKYLEYVQKKVEMYIIKNWEKLSSSRKHYHILYTTSFKLVKNNKPVLCIAQIFTNYGGDPQDIELYLYKEFQYNPETKEFKPLSSDPFILTWKISDRPYRIRKKIMNAISKFDEYKEKIKNEELMSRVSKDFDDLFI